MTNATDLDPRHAGERRADFGLVTAGDRTAEFRHARRRSAMVRALRWALPVVVVVVVGGYVLTILERAGLGTGLPDLALRQILPKDLAMDNPRYEGFGKDGSSYVFGAKTAQQDLTTPTQITLNAITGTILQADKSKTDVTAVRGVFDHKRGVLELFEQIDVSSESGLKAKLTRATIITKDNVLVSKEPVVVEFPAGTIRSKSMTLRQKLREVSFVDTVEAHLTLPRETSAAQTAGAQEPSSSSSLFAPSDAPIDIASMRLDINDKTKISVFSGNVTATQGEAELTTPELEVSYEGGPAGSNAASPASGPAPASGKISRIVAKNPVVMTRGEGDRVTCEKAEFDAIHDTAVLSGNVVMTSGADRTATSDRADLDQGADTALLTGEPVVVVQGRNELKGRRLFVDRKAGHTQLTSPPGAGGGPGRVTAHLSRGPQKQAPTTKDAASGAKTGVASFKTDPNAPVEVEADQLDVMDNTKVAVFRGDVHATQGGFVIKSAELHAFYSGDAGLADIQPREPGTAKGAASNLTRIEAKKDVVVSSKDGQKASGDWATFDAKTNMATVGGDVVLTQGQNVVRGTRLVIDMTSGESTIDTAPQQTSARPAGGGWVTEAPEAATPENKGRASAIFFPQHMKDAKGGKNPAKGGAQSAPDGWEARTDPGLPQTNGN